MVKKIYQLIHQKTKLVKRVVSMIQLLTESSSTSVKKYWGVLHEQHWHTLPVNRSDIFKIYYFNFMCMSAVPKEARRGHCIPWN